MNQPLSALFDALWQDYSARLCPSAAKVQQIFNQDVPILNDHIALRTFALPKLSLSVLARPFEQLGYQAKGSYHFPQKHLFARHYEHSYLNFPKVFISELCLHDCSKQLQDLVMQLAGGLSSQHFTSSEFLYQGRLWDLDWQTYQTLLAESEYAAWVAAHGFGANHFTINVNHLKHYNDLVDVNQALKSAGFRLNHAGGEIKGGAHVYLAQSAILADSVMVDFSDGAQKVLGGFYEFAQRYPLASGQLYQGFVEASADKIFESTNR